MPDVTVTVADKSGHIAQAVASYTVGSGGPLAPGVRAAPGTVGYLGPESALTVLNPGQSLAGTAFAGKASWDAQFLIITGSNVVADHYRINAGVWITGQNFTLTNSVVSTPGGSGSIYGLTNQNTSGLLKLEDVTVKRQTPTSPSQPNLREQSMVQSEGRTSLKRCDVSMGGDQVHVNVTGGTLANPGLLISQCYIHSNAKIDPDQHCDGVQWYNVGGFGLIEHCYIQPKGGTPDTTVPDYTHSTINASMTCGTEDLSDPLTKVNIRNNFFGGGQHHLRINMRLDDIRVVNNDFAPRVETWELSEIDVDPTVVGAITEWSGNRRSNGTLIPKP